jgi:hypothetical protein
MVGPTRRQFLLGGAAGGLFAAAGCAHRGAPPRGFATRLALTSGELPQYTQLQSGIGPDRPANIADAERESPLLIAQANELKTELQRPPLRPADDKAILVIITDGRGPISMVAPTGEQCLLFFTSPYAASDYQRLRLRDMSSLLLAVSSASEVVRMLPAVKASASFMTIDKCPRCPDAAVMPTDVMTMPDRIIYVWSAFMATKKARSDMYLSFANKARDAGNFALARDIALAQVAHVTPDDSRAHQLLHDVAVELHDATLQREADAYLAFLHAPA